MNINKCDICGKETLVNPPTEVVLDKNNKPILIDSEYQDFNTGEIKTKKINKIKDLKPRSYIIYLKVGGDTIQKDFCFDCLSKVLPEAKALYNKLKEI